MQKGLLIGLTAFCLSTGAAFAQEFTTTPRVRPQPIPIRPPIEENSNSSVLHKLFTTQKKYQLFNPGAASSYGSGDQVILVNPIDPKERPNVWKLFSISF